MARREGGVEPGKAARGWSLDEHGSTRAFFEQVQLWQAVEKEFLRRG